MSLLRPLRSLFRVVLFAVVLVASTPTSSSAQSATCEVCIPPDYAAACVAARDAAKHNRRAADVCEGSRAGSEAAHGRALRDLAVAHEQIGRLKQEREDRWPAWQVAVLGAGGGVAATILALILAR